MNRYNFPACKNERRKTALERQERRNKISNTEQLVRLDSLLGPGVGAKKERERLSKVNVVQIPTITQEPAIEKFDNTIKMKSTKLHRKSKRVKKEKLPDQSDT